MSESALLADEARYCSFGDTVHYVEPPKIFERCEGSYLFDARASPYLDLQMWYSAVDFGYANPRLSGAMKRQLDTLPQVASQYLHRPRSSCAHESPRRRSPSGIRRVASTSTSAARSRSRIRWSSRATRAAAKA